VITGELKGKVDRIWDAFWSGGIANPLEVMEQVTYLLFIRRLDDLQTAKENKANRLGRPIESPIFPAGSDSQGRPYADLRWSRFKDRDPAEMFAIVGERVFPFMREIGGDGSTYSHHMRDARFTIPTPALLAKVVDMLDDVPMEGRDTKGDVYEYMLSKIATAGQNGQFRTPRHIIALMVAMTAPTPTDQICDPACGTAGFLIAASGHVRRAHPEVEHDQEAREHFHHSMFHGFDFDSTMLRIGSMNMLLHGIEAPDIRYRDSLSAGAGDEEGLYRSSPTSDRMNAPRPPPSRRARSRSSGSPMPADWSIRSSSSRSVGVSGRLRRSFCRAKWSSCSRRYTRAFARKRS
jgi:type I restriction enzyme M protein